MNDSQHMRLQMMLSFGLPAASQNGNAGTCNPKGSRTGRRDCTDGEMNMPDHHKKPFRQRRARK